MPTSPHLQLSTLPLPRDFTPSLANNLSSSTSVLSLTSPTQSPLDSSNLDMSLASRIPPELLLDIFSIVSDSPSIVHKQYLERNRNLKSFALVHRSWWLPAREVLQKEVHIRRTNQEPASDEEIERISGLFIDRKLEGMQYLTIHVHLNRLMANTGYDRWSQLKYLMLYESSRTDRTTHMTDLARFPHLRDLHLIGFYRESMLCFDPFDVDLRFSQLCRITFSQTIATEGLLEAADNEHLALLSISHKLFSPSNMPNLRHLALDGNSDYLSKFLILLAKVLPQITTLAIADENFSTDDLVSVKGIFDNLRHLSLDTGGNTLSDLLNDGGLDLESLHLTAWMIKDSEEMISGLIRIAKCEDPKNRIKRIIIYEKLKKIEREYKGLVNGLESLEWREDQDEPPYVDFDGR